ncbi:MAG: PrsW family intramembrane metalloprotease [Patescibacteria group bacterium]|mgnify:FL=1
MDFRIFLYIVFGILPSLTWLFYYLRKDKHPESKRMILKIFIWGAVVTLPVFFVQIALATLLSKLDLAPIYISIIYWFIVISFTEEIFKYFVVKSEVFSHHEFDEPVDAMIYMVIAALGFAALENILYLFSPIDQLSFNDVVNRTIMISFIRFIGATFLHTLCSALIGYFLAFSFRETKKRWVWFVSGIIIATLLHGLYDFSIMTIDGPLKVIIPVAILISLAIFVISRFEKLKKIKSICLIN